MFWLAQKFNRPDFAAYQFRHTKVTPFDVIWYRPSRVEKAKPALDKYFPGAEVVTMRSAWDDPRAFFVGFKAGRNKVGHSQLDLGTFVLDAFGYRWAADLGLDDYNLPGYFNFSGERWDYYRLRAEGHNTLVFNPGEKTDQDPDASIVISDFTSQSNLCKAVVDLSAAYGVGNVQRTFAFRDRKSLLVKDEIKTGNPVDLWWSVHTPAQISLSNKGFIATLRQGAELLIARIQSPADAKFTILDAQPLPGTPHPARQDKNTGIRRLAIHLPGITNVQLAVTFGAH
jgi:hypothetical protein